MNANCFRFTKQHDSQGLKKVVQNNPYRIHFTVQVLKTENSPSYLLKSNDPSNSRCSQVSQTKQNDHTYAYVCFTSLTLERIMPPCYGLSSWSPSTLGQTGVPISVLMCLAVCNSNFPIMVRNEIIDRMRISSGKLLKRQINDLKLFKFCLYVKIRVCFFKYWLPWTLFQVDYIITTCLCVYHHKHHIIHMLVCISSQAAESRASINEEIYFLEYTTITYYRKSPLLPT